MLRHSMHYAVTFSTAALIALALSFNPQSAFASNYQISQTDDIPPDIIIDDPNAGGSSPPSTPTDSETRFSCQLNNGQYTVMYHPESQPGQGYSWAVPRSLGGGWTAQERCAEISRRLESYRPDGLLELRTAVENNYNTVCVTSQSNPSCRIVLTVPPGQDPILTRDRVFENLTLAENSQSTVGVNTFTEGNSGNQLLNQFGQILNLPTRAGTASSSNSINLRPFLDPTDGGTGTQLNRSSSQPSNSPRLNPDRFR